MNPSRSVFGVMTALALMIGYDSANAGVTGVEVLGSARFTVVTPQLIRMEYVPGGKFVDAPSWFARNRLARDNHYTAHVDGHNLTIDTGVIHLTYADDKKPFTDANLHAHIKVGDRPVDWKPGTEPARNLGGTLRGLDRVRAAVPLSPGLLSRDGWYLIDDSTSVLAKGDWFTERPTGHGLDWYFFGYGLDYKAALKSLTTVSGDVPMPRKSTMGAWYSRNWPYTEAEFKQIVAEYHQNDFPLDNIVMDYGWHQKGWTGYTWNTDRIPDATELLKWYHDQRLAVTVNDHPDASVQPTESMYGPFMKAMGQSPDTGKTIPFDAGDEHFFDTFWKFTHLPLMKQGVDFWWLDIGKPAIASLPSLDGLAMLNDFYFKHTQIDGRRGQSFSRWGGWGDHRNPIHFSGDADSAWSMLAFEVPFTSTSGNVGLFFWSHDTGGYRGGRNEESYTRWAQFSAVSATLRSHSAGQPAMDRRPWKYPDWALNSMRDSFHLRATLIPYVYSIARKAALDSVPFIRPLYFGNPVDEAAYHNGQEYYFGDNMLAAPITTPGHGQNHLSWQHVYFPEGTWYQLFAGEKYTGPDSVIAAADINEFPLFVRGGVPVPMQPYTERPTSAPLKNLVIRCFPGADGQTGVQTLYEDDGVSADYLHGGSATTALSYERHGDDITVRVAPTSGHYDGQVTSRAYTIIFSNTQKGSLADPSGATLTYDERAGENRIEIPTRPVGQEVVVKIHAADLDPAAVRDKVMTHRLDGLLGKPYAQWTDVDKAALSPGVSDAVQAIRGIGLMPVNQSNTLYGDDVKLVYFNPELKQPTHAMLGYNEWTEPVKVADGQPIDFTAAAAAIPAVDTIRVPGVDHRMSIHVGGTSPEVGFYLPQLAYNLGNLATAAHPSASNGRSENAIDGVADGYPGSPDNEWSVKVGTPKVWIKLTWPTAIKAKRILLYDRPNLNDQVLGGRLAFSDGSTLEVGELPNDGRTPLSLTFAEKEFTWVRFEVTRSSPSTKAAGLAEFGVFDR